eukprot:6214612-Pleurochrysis_carterae.AAC.1
MQRSSQDVVLRQRLKGAIHKGVSSNRQLGMPLIECAVQQPTSFGLSPQRTSLLYPFQTARLAAPAP